MEVLLNFSYSPSDMIFEFLSVFIIQVFLSIFVSGGLSVFYVFWKVVGIGGPVEPRPVKTNQVLSEIRWGLMTCAIIAAYMYVSFSFLDRIYPSDWITAISHTLLFLVLYDFLLYFVHRVFHTKRLAQFHARHHKSISSTPWSGLSLHPVQTIANYAPFLVFSIFFPVSLSVFLGLHIFLLMCDAYGHSNYNILSGSARLAKFQRLVCFHQEHHSKSNGNYGLFYTHWDTVFNTKCKNN